MTIRRRVIPLGWKSPQCITMYAPLTNEMGRDHADIC
jgi:hypothetical protein